MKKSIVLSAAAFLTAFAATVAIKLSPELTRPKHGIAFCGGAF
jgi:hypothetical protein